MNDSIIKPDRYSHPGKAGRKPKPSTLVSRALAIVDKQLPAIFEALIKKATEGDREAQIYLIDRRLGKPKQQTDLDISGGQQLGSGLVVELFKILSQKQKELRDAERTGQNQLPEGVYEEKKGDIEAKSTFVRPSS